jgi:hypothetical protein
MMMARYMKLQTPGNIILVALHPRLPLIFKVAAERWFKPSSSHQINKALDEKSSDSFFFECDSNVVVDNVINTE